MPRILAIDWDRHEVRCLFASGSGTRVKVQTVLSAPREVAEEHAGVGTDLGPLLQKLLAGHSVGRASVVVGVDRGSVEMLDLSVPPAKGGELYEFVLNQAMRQSTVVSEESGLDYVVEGEPAEGPQRISAAALPAEQLAAIKAACSAAGLKPRRLVMRSYAAASLIARLSPVGQQLCLLVHPMGTETDLVVLDGGKPLYLRTVRLPGTLDEEKNLTRLLAEIQRTLAVAVPGAREEGASTAVYVLGGSGDYPELIARLTDELGLAASVFDPLAALQLPPEATPDHPGRFAALAGMALDEASGAAAHKFDFLRVHKVASGADRRQKIVVGAGLAFMVVVGGLWFIWDTVGAAEAENRKLQDQYRELGQEIKKAGDQSKVVEAVRQWQTSDITWLDELRDLSFRLPVSRDMVVLKMSMNSSGKTGGGTIEMNCVGRSPNVVQNLETIFRDDFHQVRSPRMQERIRDRYYPWHFETSFSVDRRAAKEYTSHLPTPPDGPAATATQTAGPTGPGAASRVGADGVSGRSRSGPGGTVSSASAAATTPSAKGTSDRPATAPATLRGGRP